MYEQLFRNQRALSPESLKQHAQTLGLDTAKFNECLDSGRRAVEIRKDMADAEAANIEGTPNFTIGIVNPKNPSDPRILVLKSISGAAPYAAFKSALDAALAAAETLK
jgi:predicted DsbA family dithiol-disulfide isomerase